MTYPCGHDAGWYIFTMDSVPRCLTCSAPVPNPPAQRLFDGVRGAPHLQLRLIEGGGEGDSGTTVA